MYQTKLIKDTFPKSIKSQCQIASKFGVDLAHLSLEKKNDILYYFQLSLFNSLDLLLKANQKDIDLATQSKLDSSTIDAIRLTKKDVEHFIKSIHELIELDDPVGHIIEQWDRPNGLSISKICVPLGTIGIITEARPKLTFISIAQAIKSGNSLVICNLLGDFNTTSFIVSLIHTVLESFQISKECVQLLDNTSIDGVKEFISMSDYIQLIIPRYIDSNLDSILSESKIPMIQTNTGNCHIYVDEHIDFETALSIIINAKCSRPAACNSCECLLIHESIAESFLPILEKQLLLNNVTIKCCPIAKEFMVCSDLATDIDWSTSYKNLTLSIKVIPSIQDACSHINTYGFKHTETVLSTNETTINYFSRHINAATVIVNASPRFSDSGAFGFGLELAISTQTSKIRGPMSCYDLMSHKYVVHGTDQIRT